MFHSLPFLATATALSLFSIGATLLRSGNASPDGGPPRVAVCGKSNGEVSREALLAASSIELHGCVESARIVSFTLRFSDGKGAGVEFAAKGDALTKAMIEHLRKAATGTVITVTDLQVTDDKGTAWKVPEASYTLTA